MSDTQLKQLMSPWLGAQVDVASLPLPRLLEVYLTSEQGFDYAAAQMICMKQPRMPQ